MRKMNSIKAKPLSISLKLHVVLYYIFLIIAPFLLLVALSVNIMYKYTCRIYGKYLVTNLASTQEQLNTAYNRYRDTSMTLYLNKNSCHSGKERSVRGGMGQDKSGNEQYVRI